MVIGYGGDERIGNATFHHIFGKRPAHFVLKNRVKKPNAFIKCFDHNDLNRQEMLFAST